MSKQNLLNWKIVSVVASLFLTSFFPSSATAVGETPSPSPSPTESISPSPSPTPVVSPSPSASPTPSPTPSTATVIRGYDISTANSLSVVVNKKLPLNPLTYLPRGKVKIGNVWVTKATAEAYQNLRAAVSAQKLGNLCVNSGFRSFESQKIIHARQVTRLGRTAGEKLAARPGHSEHQTGLAIDVSTTALGCRISNFGASRASKWIAENAWQYGFIVRYPSNTKTAVTGYVWEPWHLRFVGLDLASQMQAEKITTMEEFFGLPAAPKY